MGAVDDSSDGWTGHHRGGGQDTIRVRYMGAVGDSRMRQVRKMSLRRCRC